MEKRTLESAFAVIAPDSGAMTGVVLRLRERFAEPHRAYHNEAHTLDVLSRLYEWTNDEPAMCLVAAALYHDAIYDPTRKDNEARSAEFFHQETSQDGLLKLDMSRVSELILMTASHIPSHGDAEAVLLADADLHILGGTSKEYDDYRKAIRAEYSHVPDEAWRAGRAQVLSRFLERPQIFHGAWIGVAAREDQARRNLAQEIDSLTAAGEITP